MLPASDARSERGASWLELFFDLVYVAAIAALAHELHDEHSVVGLAVFGGLFVPVWWAWRSFTWYSSSFGTGGWGDRVGLLVAMLASAVLAAGLGGAAQGDSTTFVVAYAGLLVVLCALHGAAWRREPTVRAINARQVVGNGLGAVLWLASLAVDEDVRPVLWAMAMLVLIGTPLAVLAQPLRAYDSHHIAERYGLFTLIVLGESVVVTVEGFEAGSGAEAVAVAVVGFVMAGAIWWVYFDRFRGMPGGGPAVLFVWAQVHGLVFAGIAAAAVGIEFCVEAAASGQALQIVDRLPLGAGLAAYLAAMAAIRSTTRRADIVVGMRLGAGLVILALAVGGDGLGPFGFVGMVGAVFVAEAAMEMWRWPPVEQAS